MIVHVLNADPVRETPFQSFDTTDYFCPRVGEKLVCNGKEEVWKVIDVQFIFGLGGLSVNAVNLIVELEEEF